MELGMSCICEFVRYFPKGCDSFLCCYIGHCSLSAVYLVYTTFLESAIILAYSYCVLRVAYVVTRYMDFVSDILSGPNR